MQNKLLQEAEKYAKQNRGRRVWRKFVQTMACIVVFCTTYALILPAITMEKTQCEIEEHTHSESCYEKVNSESGMLLSCTYETLGVHVHTSDCYDTDSKLICGQADYLIHEHNADCVNESGTVICQIPVNSGHVHTDDCYSVAEAETEPAHTHTDACYTAERGALICQLSESEGHSHGDGCFTQGELVCQLPESEGHTHGEGCSETVLVCDLTVEPHAHGEGCYQQLVCDIPEGEDHAHTEACSGLVLVCDLTEQAHVHADACYQINYLCVIPETEGHSHGAACYESLLVCERSEEAAHQHTDDCYEMVSALICQITSTEAAEETQETTEPVRELICTEPVAQVHVHSDDCFEEVPEGEEPFTCTLAEGHVHNGACYGESGEVICGEKENHVHGELCYGTWLLICTQEEHTHNLVCQNDPTADVETSAVWEASVASVTLTGEWSRDVVAIARSQLGYQESTRNYEIMEDGQTIKGYTRYGDWYGIPYGDWCAMFVSFCLNYAEIPQEAMPYECGCSRWVAILQNPEYDLYRSAEEYTPVPGDVVFFDLEEDGICDHVGLVTEFIPATGTESAKVKTIEGNFRNQVMEVERSLDEGDIMGYGQLPEKPVYYCGLEEHTHAETCYDVEGNLICEIEEHTHDEECLAEVAYYCGLEEHTHAEACYDPEGNLICEIEEHTHGEECLVEHLYLCGQEEHTHDEACYDMEGNLVCETGEHIHSKECLVETLYYCGLEEHTHEPSCYTIYNDLQCGMLEHTHDESCLNQAMMMSLRAAAEASVDMYHNTEPLYYQWSDYRLTYKLSTASYSATSSPTRLFLLIPLSQKGSWTASAKPWSPVGSYNYTPAYCVDWRISSSTTGAEYSTLKLDNSRFTDDSMMGILSAIVNNAYPFVPDDILSARLTEAYANKELRYDIVNCKYCGVQEYITAAQWAIWETSTTGYEFGWNGFEMITDDSNQKSVLIHTSFGHGNTDNGKNHIRALKDWLRAQTLPERLVVESYDVTVDGTGDTRNVQVTVTFDRDIRDGETVTYSLTAAGETGADKEVIKGNTLEVTMENVSYYELLRQDVRMNISVDSEGVQPYFYDSNGYQDMISGKWTSLVYDLSFDVKNGEKISVSASKVWVTPDTHPESTTVQLMANNIPYGDPVVLSEENNWLYIWEDVPTHDIENKKVTYTLKEEKVSGFYSTLTTADQSPETHTYKVWRNVSKFTEGGQYIFLAPWGALGGSYNAAVSASEGGTWNTLMYMGADLSTPDVTDPNVIWTATGVASDGSYAKLTSNGTYNTTDTRYMGINSDGEFWLTTNTNQHKSVYLVDAPDKQDDVDLKYMVSKNNGTRYFVAIEKMYAVMSTATTNAQKFAVYELREERAQSDINFILTNTKLTADHKPKTIVVEKEWIGRHDSVLNDPEKPIKLTVYLYRNDALLDTVVLTKDNDWKYQWTNMPTKDSDGNDFIYRVEEKVPTNFNAYYSSTETDTQITFKIKNVYQIVSVAMHKRILNDDSSKLLPDAEFDLWQVDANADTIIPGTSIKGKFVKHYDTNGTVQADGKVKGAGQVWLGNLIPGTTYYLVETKAPPGYNLLPGPIGFIPRINHEAADAKNRYYLEFTSDLPKGYATMNAAVDGGKYYNGVYLKVFNEPGYVLPETGGAGTQLYTMGGLLLMAAAILLYIHTQKRRREAGSSF